MEDLLFSGVANPRFTLGFPVLKITKCILMFIIIILHYYSITYMRLTVFMDTSSLKLLNLDRSALL